MSDAGKRYLDQRTKELIGHEKQILADYLKADLQKPMTHEQIEQSNMFYTVFYDYILGDLGFQDFKSAYEFTNSIPPTEKLIKGGQKDLSKLTATKRTVMRGGKPVTITVYEGGDEEEGNKDPSKKKEDPPLTQVKGQYVSKEEAKKAVKGVRGSGVGDLTNIDQALILGNSEGAVVFTIVNGTLIIKGLKFEDSKVAEGTSRAFYQSVKLCLKHKLNLIISDELTSFVPYVKMYMLKHQGDFYTFSYKDMAKVFGKLRDNNES